MMRLKDTSRYNVSENEDYEKDSANLVLKNYLRITSKEIMDQVEAKELMQATSTILS